MIRPLRIRRLKPGTMRSIRHWAIELAVVVVGVLLALLGAEWAERSNQRAELAAVEADMIEELRANAFAFAVHDAHRPCFVARVTEMRDLLVAGRREWPGLRPGAVYVTMKQELRFPSVMAYPSIVPTDDSWQYAEEQGLLRLMDPERRTLFADAFAGSRRSRDTIVRVQEMRDQLSGLVFPGELTPELRHESIAALRDLDARLVVLERLHPRLVETIRDLGIRSDARTPEAIARFYADNETFGTFAPCFGEVRDLLADEAGGT